MSENTNPNQPETEQTARYTTQKQEAAVKALQQRAQPKEAELTAEEIKRICNLPTRQMRVGNIIKDIICDEKTGFIYYVNPNATGLYNRLENRRTRYNPERFKQLEAAQAQAQLQAREQAQKEQVQTQKTESFASMPILSRKPKEEDEREKEKEKEERKAKSASEAEPASEQSNSHSLVTQEEQEKKEKKKREKKGKKPSGDLKKKVLVLGIVATLVVGGVCAVPVIQEMIQQQQTDTPPNEEDPASAPQPDPEPPDPKPVANNSSIVQVVHDLIPGDIITEDDLREAVISTETYNQITLQGINLYQWSRADALVGMYVQNYLPAGQYVSFSSVGAAYEPPKTLWSPGTYIDLPLTEEQQVTADFIPGEKVNVVIRKAVTQESPVTQNQEAAGNGGTATTIVQTTTIEEYSLPNTTICDVFTGEAATHSLYEALDALSTVPAGEQSNYIHVSMQKDAFADKFNQKVVRVYVNKEDMEKIGDVSNLDKVTISLEKTGDFSKDNDERATFVASAQATMKNIQAEKQAMAESATAQEQGGAS